MKYPFILTAALSVLLFSCGGNEKNDPKETANKEDHHGSNKKEHEDHGAHNKANHYMNQSDFDKLTERFESPERNDWQKPELVLKKLGDLKGKTVADIGAGTGYFGFRLADAGASVISIDVDERFIEYVEKRKEDHEGISLSTRLAEYDNPRLKKGEVDMILTVDTYHHFDDKIEYLKKCMDGLKADGTMVVIDFKKEDTPHGPPADHRVAGSQIVADLHKAGFSSVEMDTETLPEQNIIIAKK